MRKRLDRYLLAECVPPLGLALVVFTFVLLMHQLLRLSDLVVAKGVPAGVVLHLLSLLLPALLPLLLPVSLLLAVLLAVGRLSADSEIVAMRACGISLAQNLRPVLVLSALACLVTAATSLWLQPWAAQRFKEVLYDSVKNRVGSATTAGVFTTVAPGVTVYAESLDDATGDLENLFVTLSRGRTRDVWILARRGSLQDAGGAIALALQDGEMHQYGGPGAPYRRLQFQRYQLKIPIDTQQLRLDEEEAPTAALWRAAVGPEHDRAARLELHRRLALPVSCLVLGVLGATLGLHHSRGGKSRGVTLCLVVLLCYYALLTAGRVLGKRTGMPPEVAMWLPNAVLGTAAVYAYRRKSREAPLPLEETLGRWAAAIRSRLRPPRRAG